MAPQGSTVIIDTQCANLASVVFALQRIGSSPVVSADPAQLLQAERLILPGVGSAHAAMRKLKEKKLVEIITSLTQPVLGICLGMQLLASFSEEGHCNTLNIIPENIRHLEKTPGIQLPHMGWNRISYHTKNHPLLEGIDKNSYFYFVHSYAWPVDSYTVATCCHGQFFSAIIQKNNFMGVQFHPERSGKTGERLLKNFLAIPV